jgi:hypothetical protein
MSKQPPLHTHQENPSTRWAGRRPMYTPRTVSPVSVQVVLAGVPTHLPGRAVLDSTTQMKACEALARIHISKQYGYIPRPHPQLPEARQRAKHAARAGFRLYAALEPGSPPGARRPTAERIEIGVVRGDVEISCWPIDCAPGTARLFTIAVWAPPTAHPSATRRRWFVGIFPFRRRP